MIRRLTIPLLVCLSFAAAVAQAPTAPAPAPAAIAPPALPKDFLLVGAAATAGKASELGSYGHCGVLTADFCSFSTVDATSMRLFVAGKFNPTMQTAVRTGGAYRVKTLFGRLAIFTLADVGAGQATTSGGSTVGLSASGGGFGAIAIGTHFGFFAGARMVKTLGGAQPAYEAGAAYRID